MNRVETLEWIEIVLDALDKQEMLAIIRESLDDFGGQFFEVLEQETERYKIEGEVAKGEQLLEIGRVIASIRQNRSEGL
ncbi:MAG: hypothetical protein ACE5H9_10680 [Anaerolineae bacterium]